MKALLIGGSNAGQVVEVDEYRPHITMRVKINFVPELMFKQLHSPAEIVAPLEEYRRQTLIGKNGKEYVIFVIDDKCPIERLLNGYRPITGEIYER